eukprot:25464_5
MYDIPSVVSSLLSRRGFKTSIGSERSMDDVIDTSELIWIKVGGKSQSVVLNRRLYMFAQFGILKKSRTRLTGIHSQLV